MAALREAARGGDYFGALAAAAAASLTALAAPTAAEAVASAAAATLLAALAAASVAIGIGAGVTTTAGAGAGTTISSFLLQADRATSAAREARTIDLFICILRSYRGREKALLKGTLCQRPSVQKRPMSERPARHGSCHPCV